MSQSDEDAALEDTLFTAACCARNEGRLEEAIELFQRVVDLRPSNSKVMSLTLAQIGHVHDKLGHNTERERYFREAAKHGPNIELVSLGLFHALIATGKITEALQEALRVVRRWDSRSYRELFAGTEFRDELDGDDRQLADQVREQLASRPR